MLGDEPTSGKTVTFDWKPRKERTAENHVEWERNRLSKLLYGRRSGTDNFSTVGGRGDSGPS